MWFHCQHRFPPGATTVNVDTKLPATAAYHKPFRENLFYRIDTGAGWKGPIGSEEVAIHFPRPLRPEDIEKSEPPGAVLDGDTVRWRFEDFKPVGHDHDISLQFLHPCVLPILDDLRQQSAKAPHDLHKKLNLIKHLLALCDYRHSFPEPPQDMTSEENERILAMLRSDADRARFRKLFVLEPDGLYWAQDENDELSTMLGAVGYVPAGAQSKFLTEGRELLAQFLKEHPHNADAWNIDLLHFAGAPQEPGVAAFQMVQIKTALTNCPNGSDDPPVECLWLPKPATASSARRG